MLFDIGTGILLSLWVSKFFHIALTSSLIMLGIFFVLAPDFDFLVELFRHGSVGGREIREHRQISHFPLTYIPVIAVILVLRGPLWASFIGLAILAHFAHDSAGIGWGIKWMWPFSNKWYKCFSEKNGDFSPRLLISWSPEELTNVAAAYAHPDWFRFIYLRAHPINIIESAWFAVSLCVLYFFTH